MKAGCLRPAFGEALEMVRILPPVVIVEEGDAPSCRRGDAALARRHLAGAARLQRDEPGEPEPARRLGALARAVVDHDDLDAAGGQALARHRGDGAPKEGHAPAGRDDDAELDHGSPIPPRAAPPTRKATSTREIDCTAPSGTAMKAHEKPSGKRRIHREGPMSTSTSTLAGKIAWITGAGSGIGRASAIALAGAGARLALTGRRRGALEETKALLPEGAEAVIVPADLAAPEAIAKAHRAVVAALGDPEILVNNAGWNIGQRHWRDMSVEGMAGVIDVDLKAPFALSIAVLPAMRARRQGTLIHISSLAAFSFNAVSGASYTAAKLGMLGMSD